MITGNNAKLIIIDELGVETEVENVTSVAGPKILIVGDSLCGSKKLIQALIALDMNFAVASQAINSFNRAMSIPEAIHLDGLRKVINYSPHGMLDHYENDQPRNRDHGWYQKFYRPNGKRNRKV
jgi:hypothetical protein